MKRSELENLARRGAHAEKNPLGGYDVQLEPTTGRGFWDEFCDEFYDVLSSPSFSNNQATFAIRARYGTDDYGFCCFSKVDHIVCMNTLYVFPHVRGFGVATKVLTELAKGRPLLAQVLPFRLRSKSTTWNVPVEATSRNYAESVLSEKPEDAGRLLELYKRCGWRPCVVASSPQRKYVTTLEVSLNGFIHLTEPAANGSPVSGGEN